MQTENLIAEIEAGQGETLFRAAQRMPRTRRDKPVTLGCLLRWVRYGVKCLDGRLIQLEAARLAGKWITTPGAIRRFIAAQTPAPRSTTDSARLRTPTQRQRANSRADEQLKAHGL